MQLSHPEYGLIFVGFSDGAYIEANIPGQPNDTFGAGYDPRKRPWYTQNMEKKDELDISAPYLSSSGAVVCSVTSKINNPNGQNIGVLAIDFNLTALTNYLAKLKIGRSGHVVVIAQNGLILAAPADPSMVFKQVGDTKDAAEKAFFEQVMSKTESTLLEFTLNGKVYQVLAHPNKDFGWHTAMLIEKDEMLEGSVTTRNNILLLGLVLGLLMLAAVFFLSRSLTRPITLLVDASGHIAEGDFTALPDSGVFSGELLALHGSLKKMITNLSAMIADTKAKAEEAE
jgi:methyl-accepting chemotaxis protein